MCLYNEEVRRGGSGRNTGALQKRKNDAQGKGGCERKSGGSRRRAGKASGEQHFVEAPRISKPSPHRRGEAAEAERGHDKTDLGRARGLRDDHRKENRKNARRGCAEQGV